MKSIFDFKTQKKKDNHLFMEKLDIEQIFQHFKLYFEKTLHFIYNLLEEGPGKNTFENFLRNKFITCIFIYRKKDSIYICIDYLESEIKENEISEYITKVENRNLSIDHIFYEIQPLSCPLYQDLEKNFIIEIVNPIIHLKTKNNIKRISNIEFKLNIDNIIKTEKGQDMSRCFKDIIGEEKYDIKKKMKFSDSFNFHKYLTNNRLR